jgi:hypothetical protein
MPKRQRYCTLRPIVGSFEDYQCSSMRASEAHSLPNDLWIFAVFDQLTHPTQARGIAALLPFH